MSGIYGMVRYGGVPVQRETLAPMAEAMSFWGRDGHGQWCGESAGLGHLMLRTTPESMLERLPTNIRVAPHLIITADARIDNRAELFDALGVPDNGREQTPDSSLILLAFERWGAGCVPRLLGDFAFAIWNTKERTLFCARDPFGCVPFVYRHDGGGFSFASDVRAVLAVTENPKLNEPLLAAWLQMSTYFAELRQTFFVDIVKLPPGHTLTVNTGGLQLSRYWSPDDVAEIRSGGAGDLAEAMGSLFRQAVECRVRSAFPIGSHLSGGVDSSAVTIAAARILRVRGEELAMFSWSPPPQVGGRLEGEYARIDAVCRQEELVCEYLPGTRESLIATFQKDFTVEPMEMLTREANVQERAEKRKLRVILSGWGGDEAVSCRAAAPAGIQERFRDFIRQRLPDSLYARTKANPYSMHAASCIQGEFAARHSREVDVMKGPAVRRLPANRATICRYLESGHITKRAEHWAASGARNGLVYRYPLLDRRLVEFAIGLHENTTTPRRSLFLQAITPLLPGHENWELAKKEPATINALEKEYLRAHSDWATHLETRKEKSAASRYVDLLKVRKAVDSAAESGSMVALTGVREAFCCFASTHL